MEVLSRGGEITRVMEIQDRGVVNMKGTKGMKDMVRQGQMKRKRVLLKKR
jgi:hypothetical protein